MKLSVKKTKSVNKETKQSYQSAT